MPTDPIPDPIRLVDPGLMQARLFYLAKDPLPYRKLNYTLPGHEKSTLEEADDYIQGQLESWGYVVEREPVQVQAYRRDLTKPAAHQYSPPQPDDPWYTAYNLSARKVGTEVPEETIVVVSHKDSQSWIHSPGANDNAIGTVGNLEVARVLAQYPCRRSLWFLFCNEEHTPWTSATAAANAKERGENLVAVFNLDGIGVKTPEDKQAQRNTLVFGYTEPQGERLANLLCEVSHGLGLGLSCRTVKREYPNEDDGSFVKAGYPAAVIVIGSWPYGDPNYHLETDVPELTDVHNAALTVQAVVGAILRLDE